ncbi:MAG: DUF4338 domain-containing protein [Anaerolineae bacterium]|nr:DUF4338 domain-containing protein [Anaerolineae bacterium]
MRTRGKERVVSRKYLRKLIRESLRAQGYSINKTNISLRVDTKDAIRQTHSLARLAEIERARKSLSPYEDVLINYIANGNEVEPTRIRPVIVTVAPNTEYSRLFRYASLHWSIPISNGYGRRLRFLIFDETNGKLLGLLGLSDPVFGLRARDEWIGWNFEQRRRRLYNVMDAYVLGAVPPYSNLLCGKFVAMIVTSREVREAFHYRYQGRKTIILQRECPAELALVTTTSALGKSSLYNRLKYRDRFVMQRVGYTAGWGTFHFANGIYEKMLAFASVHCKGTAKAEKWGGGEFRNRKEVIRKCLQVLDFPEDWMLHRIEREVFVAPLASNTREYLRGEADRLNYWTESVQDYFEFFRERWLLPRAARNTSYKGFCREEWRLW